MRPLPRILISLFTLSAVARAEMREFTDEQGRKIKAEVTETGSGWIKVRRQDGHKFTLFLDKLSAEDRAWVEKQTKQREADAAAAKRAIEVPAKIVAYCKSQVGKQVGNGECWTLADECFKSCGFKRPGNHLREWGRKLDLSRDTPQPGDIAEYRSAKFSTDGMSGPEHTAVVTGLAKKKGVLIIAEQNWGGVKKVHETELNPAALVSGELMFYRPL